MRLEFTGELFEWRGPAPFHFVAVPEEESADLKEASSMLTYGWGVIPVQVRIGETEWETSLIPRNGVYLVPVKDRVRKSEGLQVGAVLELTVVAGGPG